MIRHALTIDVENWYHAENMRPVAPPIAWGRLESRLDRNMALVLDLLDHHSVKGTFFVLGSAAERAPAVVRDIARRGHEVACHGWSHELVYRQTPEQFRAETRRAKALLEDLAGCAVLGYRASTFSVVERSLWALDVLAEEGFIYDASIAPVRHDRYGIPDAPRDPHVRELAGGRRLAEFPVSTGRLLGWRFPVGGGFFRLFPLGFVRRALREHEERDRPAGVYLHPWEFDPAQPRQKGIGALSAFRHYARLESTYPKLDRLLGEFAFTTMVDVLREHLAGFPAEAAPR